MTEEDPGKVSYVKVLGNPGFLKCQRPECDEEPTVKAAEVYSHAWDKHRANRVYIESKAK